MRRAGRRSRRGRRRSLVVRTAVPDREDGVCETKAARERVQHWRVLLGLLPPILEVNQLQAFAAVVFSS